ncbi:MAG: hypothetical protein AABW79_01980 [Nanoarchaeota archaeon]
MSSTDDILRKYSSRIESEISSSSDSSEYLQFKEDMLPEISRYRRWTQTLGNIIKLKVSTKDAIRLQRQLDIAHLEVTPSQALTLAVFSLLVIFFTVMLSSVAIFFITDEIPLLFAFLGMLTSVFVFYYTYSMPKRLASEWRLKTSSQMVPAILYIVVYMKHTSNLERAIEFASNHLEAPLSLDLKKVFWDVEVGRFSSLKQSLDSYLETWRDYAPEFIEAFHLIESSLLEPSDSRRVQTLEKALQVILDGVYEKMLKYSREIRSPLTNIYMLGIILPTLGLALLPLASTLLGGVFQWTHVFIIFNILIPFFVFYMTSEVLLKRPGGYGESSVLEKNPQYYTFISKKPWIKASFVAIPLILLGLLPFIFQINFLTSTLGLDSDYTLSEIGLNILGEASSTIKIFDFKQLDGETIGPFGPIGVLLSLFIPIGLALFFYIAYSEKTKSLIIARNETKELENEFTNSLFQLGNRLGDGLPAEIAFARVASTTQGQRTQQFFSLVNQNIQQLGMSVNDALFHPRRGAIIFFPSALIATSMKILVESAKKGLEVAARSLMSISEYVKNIHKIEERLRDLLAEVVSDMKSNMTFLAPLLAGVVVGLSAMITSILNRLQIIADLSTQEESLGGLGSLSDIISVFDVKQMIPPYFIQVSIGIYIIEIIFILTSALVTVDAGRDPLKEKSELAKNLKRGITLYIITAIISTISLMILSIVALGGIAT